MSYIAIDPGPEKSGFVRFLNGHLLEAGHYDNAQILAMIHRPEETVIIEWLRCYGAAVRAACPSYTIPAVCTARISGLYE